MRIVSLTKEQLDNLSNKVFAEGEESTIYRGLNTLYKIYKNEIIDPEDTRKSIYLATIKQRDIIETTLPLGVVDVENKMAGVLLHPHFKHFPIQMISQLPFEMQIDVLKQAINNIEELSDNGVYPLDLSYYSDRNPMRSSVLVSSAGKVEIIGLDGSSVLYSDKRLRAYEQLVLKFANALIDDLMRRIFPIKGTLTSKRISYEEALFGSKVNEGSAKELVKGELSYDGLNNLVDQVMVKKPRF